jgi:DNA-directed RNA polymerase specialized sigma24 family protein
MPLSSITKMLGLRRDESHGQTERLFNALGRISRTAVEEGEQGLDMQAIRRIAVSAESPAPPTDEAVRQYLGALPERERAMFKKWMEGLSTTQISQGFDTQPRAVARVLARIVTDLRLLNRHHALKRAAFIV